MRPLTDEEMAKVEAEAERSVEEVDCEKCIWNLFDLAIEKNKEEGFTDQDIQLDHIPEPEDLMQILASMMYNRLYPEQFYMNPMLSVYGFPHSQYEDGWEGKLNFIGKNYYVGLSISLPPNVFYVLPAPSDTGVSAFPLFSMFPTFKEEKWIEKYVDLPEEVNKYTGFRLINVKAPYRVTVPASLLK